MQGYAIPKLPPLNSPKHSSGSGSSIAAGADTTITSTSVTSEKTGRLYGLHVSGSVRFKALLQTVLAGVPTDVEPFFSEEWRTFHPDFVKVVGAGGVEAFQVVVTNLDPELAADFYATFYWDES